MGGDKKPNFFIVGAPRCGTTSMYFYLSQHPEIYMPELKEPHFFSDDLFPPTTIIRDRDEYLSLFDSVSGQKRVGEASATYLYSKNAAKNIKDFSPDAKIIIMLRHPVDAMYSMHSEFVSSSDELITDFKKALDAELSRKKGERIGFREAPLADQLRKNGVNITDSIFLYREVVDFEPQIRRYLNFFNSENIHVILFDDFRERPDMVYKETLRFLGVSPDFEADFSAQNKNKHVRFHFLSRALNYPSQRFLALVRWVIRDREMRGRLRNWVYRLNTPQVERQPMDIDLRAGLIEEFKPKIRKLEGLLQRDLSQWMQHQ